MHAGSEHTIDGVRHDLEMHTVHYPADGVVSSTNYIASAMGLVFSVDKYTAELDFKEQ
jgi:carbonic anhydrase